MRGMWRKVLLLILGKWLSGMVSVRRRSPVKPMVAAAALGAVAAYLFDPQEGSRRRAKVEEKVTSVVGEASRTVTETGRALKERARSLTHRDDLAGGAAITQQVNHDHPNLTA